MSSVTVRFGWDSMWNKYLKYGFINVATDKEHYLNDYRLKFNCNNLHLGQWLQIFKIWIYTCSHW